MEEFYTNHMAALLCLLFGVLYIPIALPLYYKKIKRNNFYGFRLKYTLEDDDIWYAINALLGRQMFYQGITFLIIGVALFFLPGVIFQTTALVVVIVLLFVGIGFSLFTGIKLMNQMAREKGLKK